MAGYALKLKCKSGQMVLKGLSPLSTVTDLKSKLASLANIKENCLHVLSGFPPKPLDLNCDDSTLEAIGIASGDTLIIEEKQPPPDIPEKTDSFLEGRHHIAESHLNRPGILMRKVVPADNSCLFTSIGYVLGGKVDPTCSTFMRQIIAEVVSNNPDVYSEAILGQSNSSYSDWILKPDSWGGAIELAVLSEFYGLEIDVVDTLNAIINRFGEDQHYAQRVFLVFDGIHYDPLYLEPLECEPVELPIIPCAMSGQVDDAIVEETLLLDVKIGRHH
ncbi:ubiquitin thioesterase Otu1 isoform X2 [Anabrus simplex]|uniref:ubiquitin thioesterase Otu1 isoform X2 n=1 Tax=Anabrus simplex TaxID=316456 RepID=UPI0035A2E7ED